MAVKEFSGKSVEEAKALAAAELGIAEDSLVYEVIEEEKGGLFGLFRNCRISVTLPEESGAADALAEAVSEVADEIAPATGSTPSEVAVDFMYKVLKTLGFSAEITATVDD